MPVSTLAIGQQTPPVNHTVDARWLMAYAAGLGDCNPRYLDTAAGPIIAHPLFPVCLEWPAILASRDLPGYESMTEAERARGVHAAHDLHLYKPLVAGEQYSTTATIAAVNVIKPGAAGPCGITQRAGTTSVVGSARRAGQCLYRVCPHL